jgi:membrane protein DedA with SNARE-associated domain
MINSMAFVSGIGALLSNPYTFIYGVVKAYGYFAVLVLMIMEGSTLPIPSEVVLPIAGLFAAKGALNIYITIIVATLGSAIGFAIDYYIGYYLGKDVVYKHLSLFHIHKAELDKFDLWFEKNGAFAVFFTRMVPVLRTLINFPAGFARMQKKKFFLYSISAALVWNIVLTLFGYYLLAAKSAEIVLAGIGLFAIVLYLIYRYATSKMKR